MTRSWLPAFLIFSALVLVFVCAWLIGLSFTKSAKPAAATQPAALMAEISTGTPEPTATETAIPLPTLDDRYIKQQQELADIARQEADAANIKANAHSTEVENAKIIAGITATQVIATATAQAQREATLQAVQTQKAIAAPVEAQATRNAVAFMQTVEKQKQDDNRATVTAIIWQVVAGASVFVFVVVIAFLGLQIVNRKFPETFSQPVTENEAEEPEPEPQPVAVKAYSAGLDLRLFQNIATHEQLLRMRDGIRQGIPLIHDNWTPAKTHLLSEGRFTSLQYILVKYGAAEWADDTHKGGIDLTKKGYDFFDSLEETCPPLNQDAPKSPPIGPNRSIDSTFTPFQ